MHPTKAEILSIIDSYEGMLRQYPINKMPAALLEARGKWVMILAEMTEIVTKS